MSDTFGDFMIDETTKLRAECERLRGLYDELLLAVERKWPNESRHQTALRYIREAESHTREGLRARADQGEK